MCYNDIRIVNNSPICRIPYNMQYADIVIPGKGIQFKHFAYLLTVTNSFILLDCKL